MLIQLKELLSTFSERERDLFDYIHNQQLTYAEAAEKMDIKVGTAKSMSQRIRIKLMLISNMDIRFHYFKFHFCKPFPPIGER